MVLDPIDPEQQVFKVKMIKKNEALSDLQSESYWLRICNPPIENLNINLWDSKTRFIPKKSTS